MIDSEDIITRSKSRKNRDRMLVADHPDTPDFILERYSKLKNPIVISCLLQRNVVPSFVEKNILQTLEAYYSGCSDRSKLIRFKYLRALMNNKDKLTEKTKTKISDLLYKTACESFTFYHFYVIHQKMFLSFVSDNQILNYFLQNSKLNVEYELMKNSFFHNIFARSSYTPEAKIELIKIVRENYPNTSGNIIKTRLRFSDLDEETRRIVLKNIDLFEVVQ